MEFIANFWAAYVPVAIVLVAAIVELVIRARESRTPRPDKLEYARANVIMLPTRSRSSRRADAAAGAAPGRVISLQDARRRRILLPGGSGTRRSHA